MSSGGHDGDKIKENDIYSEITTAGPDGAVATVLKALNVGPAAGPVTTTPAVGPVAIGAVATGPAGAAEHAT